MLAKVNRHFESGVAWEWIGRGLGVTSFILFLLMLKG